MKAKEQCLNCIEKLTKKTLSLSFRQKNTPRKLRPGIKARVLEQLNRQFRTDKVPAAMFTRINRKIKKLTKAKDAFARRKAGEIKSARKTADRLLKISAPAALEELLLFSAKGNSLDFFKPIRVSEKDMQGKTGFTLNKTALFQKQLKKASTILFFADNSGEVFFDRPLISFLAKTHKIYYVVKSRPVQNDLTINELKTVLGLELPAIVTLSGNDAVGIEPATISPELKQLLEKSDIILAKGMGYYETFSELGRFKNKVFYLLMAKCLPVAESLKVGLHSYVFTKL